jgi:beta-glucosidase
LQSNFLWGASTSSYQVEGGISNNDWDFFTRDEKIKKRISKITKPSRVYKGFSQINLEPAVDAVKSWLPEYYIKDFSLAKTLGLNSIRISIEWSRIEPQRGIWDNKAVDHYKQMIKTMREIGLNPIVTLNHITLPLWVLTPPTDFKKKKFQYFIFSPLKELPLGEPVKNDPYWFSLRGWENQETVDEYVRYVTKIVSELKDLVDYWITIGEPIASIIGCGYLGGIWSPGFFLEGNRTKIVLHNLIEAHVKAYNVIHEIDDFDADGDGISKKVGFAHLMLSVNPLKSSSKILGKNNKNNFEATKKFSYFVNDYYINAVVKGEEDINYLESCEIQNIKSNNFIIHSNWKDKTDFIGLDYYRRVHVYQSLIISLSSAKFIGGAFTNKVDNEDTSTEIISDLGWEIDPEGLYEILTYIKKTWNKPVLITENGVADRQDKLRPKFIIDHIEQMKRAIDEDVDVIGYLHWSLMDNYEWTEGFGENGKFGLFKIDFNHSNLDKKYERNFTHSAAVFKFLINRIGKSTEKKDFSNILLEAREKFT